MNYTDVIFEFEYTTAEEKFVTSIYIHPLTIPCQAAHEKLFELQQNTPDANKECLLSSLGDEISLLTQVKQQVEEAIARSVSQGLTATFATSVAVDTFASSVGADVAAVGAASSYTSTDYPLNYSSPKNGVEQSSVANDSNGKQCGNDGDVVGDDTAFQREDAQSSFMKLDVDGESMGSEGDADADEEEEEEEEDDEEDGEDVGEEPDTLVSAELSTLETSIPERSKSIAVHPCS